MGPLSRSRLALVAAGLLALSGAACGRASGASGDAGGQQLTVFAAASLSKAFPDIAAAFARTHSGVRVTFSFAGTDALVAQIEQGAPADVFAGASAKYGDQLFAEGLIGPPVTFCTNRLVVVLPASNPGGISTLRDLARPGVKVVMGADTVPVGTYTRKVLASLDTVLGPGYSGSVLSNVVSNEDNVEGVLTKVRLGEADAGFVYVTDARAAGSDVGTIALPPEAQAVAAYPIAVVRASDRAALATAFVSFVIRTDGQRILRARGFGPPPVPAT